MTIPKDLKYTKEHEWLRSEGAVAVVGITHHAQEQLGDVVFVDLPAVGTKVEQGKTFGTVESVKAVSDLFAPISGEISEINGALANGPEVVNQDPYGKGWMLKIKPSAAKQLDGLLSADDYQKFTAKK